ncbi:hypothetical protein ASPWEDRAFT_398146 [Aspergillus wentii DTO 134E9]|uniref:Rhodopsin domain-containing protein n=1 Tax=Aspergillus wentii DTO 134E9 TaxID=1073089 RepID=A0A1L9RY89_ASPWE|nr:uncharacterized protein ASPWEDRAFT_398146 [Aspergillus wentii DTO 134E9]KAI9931469.1 hypothetical protein MW887_010044 [Aspergillus wentii]OJJ39863.1 hypothetical protein ASPWEDRAFT_398146 [Aspergillus wentii DTO 134E9]
MEDDDLGPTITAVMWVVTGVPFIIVVLRIYCKWKLSRGFGWDDTIVAFSWVLLAVYASVITAAARLGVGRHLATIPAADIPPALELVYIGEFIAIIACVLSKTSFAVTLLRIVTRPWQKVMLWFIIVTMNIVMWLTAILYFAQCSNPARLWDFSIEATCWSPDVVTHLALFAGAYSGLMDLVLAMLPWWVIWKLQMKRREKTGIAIAMSLGVFAAATAFVKTSYLPNLSKQSDFTYYCGDILIWAAAETGATIFAASIPSLRILVLKMRSSYDNSGQKYSENYQLSKGREWSRNTKRRHGTLLSSDEHVSLPGRPDDASEKSILGKSNNIKRTQEVTVSYEQTEQENMDRYNFA